MLKIKENFTVCDLVLLLSLTLAGGFHEYASCIASIILSAWLINRLTKSKKIIFRFNLVNCAVLLLVLFYGISAFWAVDSGMAFIGFLKFLPALLYILVLDNEGKKQKIFEVLPVYAAITVIISAIGIYIEPVARLFSVAGRIAGLFQYPNTFALFLIVCELLLLEKPKLKIFDFAVLAVIIGGIFLSGSRTAFVLFILVNIARIFLIANKKTRIIFILSFFGIIVLAAAVLFIAGRIDILFRYLTISVNASSFLGRLLYVYDALPLIIKYPFGMGYMGYRYLQSSIQSGIYTVNFVHNDFLQFFLDAGIIAGVVFIVAMVMFFFRKDVSKNRKLIMAAICLHTLLDFNFQFIGMLLLVLMLMHNEGGKQLIIEKELLSVGSFAAAVAACAYVGSSLLLSHIGMVTLAKEIYPYNTENNIAILEHEDDLESARRLSLEIIKANDKYYAPYSVLANYSYSKGDIRAFISYKNKVFERYPLEYNEYESYCKLLIEGIKAYEKVGNLDAVRLCEKELFKAKDSLEAKEDTISYLGWRIYDQPRFDLDKEVLDYIEARENELK